SQFTLPDENLDHESVISIPKADLLLATPTVSRLTHFENLNPSDVGYTVQPVVDFGASVGRSVLLAPDADVFGFLNRTNVLGATGAGATVSSSVNITTNPTRQPPPAQQPGAGPIDTNDFRIPGYVFKVGGSLWAAQSVGTPDYPAVNNRAGIRWYQIDEATNTVLQQANFGDTTHDYFMGSIAANQFGDVVMGFTRSSST